MKYDHDPEADILTIKLAEEKGVEVGSTVEQYQKGKENAERKLETEG